MSLKEPSTILAANKKSLSQNNTFTPYRYSRRTLDISDALLASIDGKNKCNESDQADRLTRLGGGLAFHCRINLQDRVVLEAASMATRFRGYEALLPGRDLRQVGMVSSTASGICGGVHATASALCLEMALDLSPPPLGIVLRNLLLSCQYLNDNAMHLFILSGPDYSQAAVQSTTPKMWLAAEQANAKYQAIHGYRTIGDIMLALNKPQGELYLKALQMIRLAREAYTILGGQYPHSESIVPGGVNLTPGLGMLDLFLQKLSPFYDYAKQSLSIWDDVFDFMLAYDARYQELGRLSATMVDFGQWDNEAYYDASYENCNTWGEYRWSTPAAIVNGKLMSNRLSELNLGIEEFTDHSYYQAQYEDLLSEDPLGDPLSPYHPWNKNIQPFDRLETAGQRYSWGTSITWDRHVFEVGAYARLYATAISKKMPSNQSIESTGQSLRMHLPAGELPPMQVEWKIPPLWNAFERNRARAYGIAFNLMVTVENYHRAVALLKQGEKQTVLSLSQVDVLGADRLGVGFWGAGRGFLAHWSRIKQGVIENYQICVPSRINAAPRTPWGVKGACEQAVMNTPILEENFKDENEFKGIDIQRCLQSFDPCMPSSTYILIDDSGHMINREIDTSYPI